MDFKGMLPEYLPLAIAGVLGVLGWLWGKVKIKNETLNGIMTRTREVVLLAANETNNTYVNAIKESRKDGKLTDAEKKAALTLTLAKAKSYLNLDTLKAALGGWGMLGKLLSLIFGKAGWTWGEDLLDSFLTSQVEMAVTELNNAQALTEDFGKK